jgi:formylmethanofuran dehydrogenase subunit B
MTGFPLRIGFGRGYPEHDAWRFDATRLIADGEADCALWISSYGAASPEWRGRVPTITLAGEPARSGISIQVGRPALDHDAVEHDATTGTIVARAASRPSGTLSTADVIARIVAALPGTWPC